MEHLNRVELLGIIGNIHIYNQKETAPFARLSLVTKKVVFQASTNEDAVESTWHNVVLNQCKSLPDLNVLQKGQLLRVTGRIRNGKYTGQDGQERYTSDIISSAAEIVEDTEI